VTSLGIYGHVLPSMQEGAVDKWDDTFVGFSFDVDEDEEDEVENEE
jgi:hypothetical protein